MSCQKQLLVIAVSMSAGLVGSNVLGAAEFRPPIAITNARIVTSPGQEIERGTIVLDKGRIVAVGADVTAPPDAQAFDATDMIVYPGFVDAASHAGMAANEPSGEEIRLTADELPDVREGVQSATVEAYRRLVHPHRRAEELYDPGKAKLDELRRAGLTTALVAPRAAIFAGRSAVFSLGDRPRRRSVLASDFAQHAGFVTGSRFGDFQRSAGYPTTTMGAMAAFRQMLLDSRWHRDLLAWFERNPEGERPALDRDLEAIWKALDGDIPVAFFANSENEIHRALDMAAEFKLRPMIVGAREGWKAVARLKAEAVPVILSLNWSDEPKEPKPPKKEEPETQPASQAASQPESLPESQPETRPGSQPAPAPGWLDRRPIFDERWQKQAFEPKALFEERRRLWGEEVDNAKLLHEAGVRFAIGTFELESPKELLTRLHTAIERGLPADAVLAALTRDAAALLDMQDSLGEITPGRLANLTIMSKPLSEEKAAVKWVFVEGKVFAVDLAEKKGEGDSRGSFRQGGRSGPGMEEEEEEGKEEEEQEAKEQEKKAARAQTQPASQPTTLATTQATTTTASAPAEEIDWPEFACETEADRKPRIQTGGNLLIQNATLLTITDGDLPQADLLIEDGRITAIGGPIPTPPDMMTVDLRGYCVTPGLIDAHSHICSNGGLNEWSLSVTPEVRARDVVDHTDVSAFRAVAGGVTTIHTMHGSANTIGGQNVVLRLKYGRPAAEWPFPEAPRTVKFALGENVKQSNTRGGGGGSRFPNTRMGVEAVMRRTFDEARKYQDEWAAYERDKAAGKDPRPLRRDLRLEAICDVSDGELWVHCHCYRADEILRLLSVAEDYGFRVAVLQHILEGYRLIPEMFRHGCAASTFSDWWAYKIESYDAIPQNAARLVQGGVVTTVNSDSPEVIRHMNLEAAKAIRFGGLSPNEALRLVTLNAAIQLGIQDHVGSLEVSKRADLAIFDGHPLDTFSKCVLTLIDGEVYFQHALFDLSTAPTALAVREFSPPRSPIPVAASSVNEYWIVGGAVHSVSGPSIPAGVVVIADGKIRQVGAASEVTPPPRATVIDAKGLQVYPGLINAGVPLGLIEIDSVRGTVDRQDIARFQPDLLALSAYNPFSSAIEVARAEGVTTALIPPGGGVVQGQAGVVHLDGWSMPEAELASPAALVVELPSLPTDWPPWLPEEQKEEREKQYREQMPEVEAFFRDARHYAEMSALAERQAGRRPEMDRRFEAMIPYVRGERPVFFRAGGYRQIREALRFAERYELRPVIFGGREAWKLADELAECGAEVVIARSMAYPADKFEPWDSVYRNAAVLHRSGVRFCFATEEASLAKQLGIEAGMAVAHGLEPVHALRAVTLDAAEILGVADRVGSLEPGKIADVIVTTDSPLQATNCVVAAFVAGQPVDLASKHSRLDEKFQTRPAPKLPPAPELRGPPPMRLGPAS